MTHTASDSVLEIRPSRAAIILCMGEAHRWDAAPPAPDSIVCRVATDERWIIGPARDTSALLSRAVGHANSIGPAAYAVDVSDAWAVLTIEGSETAEVWARLSENRIPSGRPAFVQGAVATIPAKALIQD